MKSPARTLYPFELKSKLSPVHLTDSGESELFSDLATVALRFHLSAINDVDFSEGRPEATFRLLAALFELISAWSASWFQRKCQNIQLLIHKRDRVSRRRQRRQQIDSHQKLSRR